MQTACAISVIFIGLGGALEKMLVINKNSIKFDGTLLLIASLIVGGLSAKLSTLTKNLIGREFF